MEKSICIKKKFILERVEIKIKIKKILRKYQSVCSSKKENKAKKLSNLLKRNKENKKKTIIGIVLLVRIIDKRILNKLNLQICFIIIVINK